MKRNSFILLFFASAIIFVLTYLQPYTLSDDVLYQCIWRHFTDEPFVPIRTFGDVIQSQIIFYQALIGRTFVHVVAQTFLGLLNKPIFNIANAIVFGITAWLAAKYVSRKKITTLTITMVLFVMMVMIPGFTDNYLWVEGSFNYLWVSLYILTFILLFENKKGKRATAIDYILSPLVLFLGWTHEAMALPLSLSLIGYCIIKRHTIARSAALPYIIWFSIGAFLCSFAPSTIMRASVEGESPVMMIVTKTALGLYSCTQLRTVWLLVIVMIYAYRKRREVFVWHIRRYGYLYSSAVLSIGIIFASGVTQLRVCYGAEFFAMLLVITLLIRLGIDRYSKPLTIAMTAITVIIMIPGIYYSYMSYQNSEYVAAQIRENKSDIIRVKPLQGNRFFIRKFVFTQVEFGTNTYYNAADSMDENVRCTETLLGRKRLVFLPDDMVDSIMRNPNSYMKYGENAAGEIFAMQVAKDKKVNKVTFILGDDNAPFYKRPFAYKGYTYDAKRWQVIEINGRHFVFFDKPIPKISRRIKDIKIS